MSNYKVLPICSLKGGVGKTTVTVEVARALTRRGFKVGILDADYHAPNVPIAIRCDGKPRRGPKNTVIPPEVEGILVLSWAMLWPPESAVMVEDSQVEADDLRLVRSMIIEGKLEAAVKYLGQLIEHPGGAMEHMQLLLRPGVIDWGDLDWLVVDTPPESTGITKIVAEASGVTGAILVSHPSRVSLADIRRTADLFRKRQLPLYGLVSNQGVDEETGRPRYDLEEQALSDYAGELGIPLLAQIPHSLDRGVLAPYFDGVAQKVCIYQPIVLPLAPIDVEGAERMIKQAKSFTDLLEALSR